MFKTAEGLTIAYLSGSYQALSFGSAASLTGLRTHYSRGDVAKMCDMGKTDGFKGVDVLLTDEWPQGITQYASVPPAREKEYAV